MPTLPTIKPWQRRALYSVGSAAVLLMLAVVAAHLLIDPDKLKALAREKAQAAYSRDLQIGKVELGLFPLPFIAATEVTFANAPWAKERYLFRADRIDAHLALIPLITGNVKLKSLFIRGGRAILEISKDGRGSWQLSAPENEATKKPAAPNDNLLELRQLRLENFAIVDQRKRDEPHLWQVNEASLIMVPLLRDVHLEADVARDGRPLKADIRLDDCSHFGEPGAATQGSILLDWGGAQLKLAGHVPLDASLEGQRLHGELTAKALGDMLGFFGLKRQPRVPIEAHFGMTGAKGDIHLHDVKLSIGTLSATGDVHVKLGGPKAMYDVRLSAGEVEWSRMLHETGGEVHQGVPAGEILPTGPMGWGALRGLKNKKGTLEAQVGRVRLGNGLTLANVKTKMTFEDDRLDVPVFTTDMLGGNASFKVRLEGNAQRGHLEMEGRNLLLERWFKERGKKIPFEGGPMQIKASLDAKGESMKDLAASMTGPVTIRMGRGVYASEKAGDVEAMLSTAAGGGQKGIRFECVAARLPFRSGRADQGAQVGAASAVSYLLTSGGIDFREQRLDLHGRLKPRSGLALATVAGDVKIFGSMAKPQIALDHAPVMARIGAAIATAGITAAATALADAATSENPCEAVFGSR